MTAPSIVRDLAENLAATVRLMAHAGVPEAAATGFLVNLCSVLMPDMKGINGEADSPTDSPTDSLNVQSFPDVDFWISARQDYWLMRCLVRYSLS